jgi:hypothetical protein
MHQDPDLVFAQCSQLALTNHSIRAAVLRLPAETVKTMAFYFISGIYFGFFVYVRYSTLLHLLPLRFHCVGGCWDLAHDFCDFAVGSQTL